MAFTAAERERYSRHLLLPEIGAHGQEKLKAARVLVVGAGGLGSPASLYLAAAGVGTLGIVDHDRVDLSNLQRQLLFDTSSLGSDKALSAQTRLRALNPEINVIAHQLELDATNALELLRQYDCVLDGSDRLSTRYLVNDACVLLQRPLVSAAIHRFEGQAMTYLPGRGPCYRCLFPEAATGVVPNCAEAGVLGVLPGVLGALQATEAIKLILGIGTPLLGRLLTYDALEMQWHEFRFIRRADCAVCGTRPTIKTLADTAAQCPALPHGPCTALQPQQLRMLMADARQSGAGITVVDVREPREFAAGHLAGALNIPVGDLPRRRAEIPLEFPVVFVCRSGVRSRAACELASGAGIQNPANLEGGMLAWAALIDPEMNVAPSA
jgi:sulfur-carrier protein adenylyltransferase/sulfurtransferase